MGGIHGICGDDLGGQWAQGKERKQADSHSNHNGEAVSGAPFPRTPLKTPLKIPLKTLLKILLKSPLKILLRIPLKIPLKTPQTIPQRWS